MARSDDDPLTYADYKRLAHAIKRLDSRIDECFDAIQKGDDDQGAFWNEHEEKLNRLTRRVNRLANAVNELTGEQ